MTDITGSDTTQGSEVRWYAGGTQAGDEELAATAGDAAAGHFALAADAEWGSVVVYNETDRAIVSTVTECSDAAGTTAGSDSDAVKSIAFTITSDKTYLIKYCAITAALAQIAASRDVRFTARGDKKTTTVHGQSNKINVVGAVENTGSIEELHYNQTFLALAIGDQMSASPTTDAEKHTTAFSGMKKIGAIVGKKFNAAGACIRKYFLMGVQFEELSDEFPTDDFYKRAMSFSCDYRTEVDLS